MTVRPATPSDAPAMASVHVRTWQTAYRGQLPDDVLANLSVDDRTAQWERLIPRGNVWVAEHDGEVAGFAFAGPSRDDDAPFELYAIYVLDSAQGTGLGTALAKAALGSEPDVIVWALDTNTRARHFYERIGFRADGVTRTETEGGVELKEMRYRRTI
ncbi:L-amino acid N-acyltransferase YncA [Lentzea fradiae]|uniref:L-amino acid N-acyltransferase YncA n=1 Tax=Lentzea fradiae TaxID=200378 RepID=A0A1G7X9P8_9PSEU|nr:GNAT family N-acetyltransferase [Lentzea fradiae]SDG80888.1 L-amino acid N-acyltransferase YncA [Lentzea fradiae]